MLYAVAKCHSNFYTIFSLLIDHLTDNIEIKTTLKCLQKSCQFQEGRNEFRIYRIVDQDLPRSPSTRSLSIADQLLTRSLLPPVVRIRSKEDKDVNSLIFSTLLSALKPGRVNLQCSYLTSHQKSCSFSFSIGLVSFGYSYYLVKL